MESSKTSSKLARLRDYPAHLVHGRLRRRVGIVSERHLDVGMAHDVLQRLGVHALVRHVGAERVAQRVRCHHGWQCRTVALLVLPLHATEHARIALREHRQPLGVEEEEVRASVDDDGLPIAVSHQNPLEGLVDPQAPVPDPLSALALRRVHVVVAVPTLEELVVHADAAALKVDVRPGETAKLRDAKARAQENHHLVIVLGVDPIGPHEGEQRLLLLG